MYSLQRTLIAIAIALSSALPATVLSATPARRPAVAPASGYERRDDVRAFIDEIAREHHLSRATMRRWFADVRYQPKIVEAMQRPFVEPPNWFEYAPQFLTPARIDEGVGFWRA